MKPRTLQMADVFERQVGGKVEQVTQEAFADDKFYFQDLDRVLDELFEEAASRGYSWGHLADMSGLHKTTVKNLGERWTKRPQYRTVMAIAAALDRKVELTVISGRSRPSLHIAKAG